MFTVNRKLKVVSGGQTGADQAALHAARDCGLATSGWAERKWGTEDGPNPKLFDFGLLPCRLPGYPARTEANVEDSDGTIWFGHRDTPGHLCTWNACDLNSKPFLEISAGITTPRLVADWIAFHSIEVLNVAGNRESKNPGIFAATKVFLTELFTILNPEHTNANRATDVPDLPEVGPAGGPARERGMLF